MSATLIRTVISWLDGINFRYLLEPLGIHTFTFLFMIGFGLGFIIAFVQNNPSNHSLFKQDLHPSILSMLKNRNHQ
ncbi:hypothetical protein QUB80_25675 [Chlorogloeopsis sp. ULAP01]|uniref:hypothetical protein n=1 Tax=Chlorogloeopsis sp. ULAP01 TaxID=3056483 RepID=UPI0025AB4B03|nr:hypothetical protein [Chlorogloeopsis sp. ULAP01]MDM9384071.1 hypothetical protein [Chlorogloeopsis sp. ULAP01]